MSDVADVQAFKSRLLLELAALDAEDRAGVDDRATVTLDQQSVGRLSRMDAMQRQAMAQATARRRDARRSALGAALSRMDDGEYGYCAECGEEIARRRLDVDPAVPVCVSCAKG